MKAVVLKVRDGQAIVMTEDGQTRKIPYSGNRGDEIDVAPTKFFKVVSERSLRAIRATAAALAVVIFGTGAYSYTEVQACSYVTMDVNPSFEYTLNRRDRVISVDALNQDAESFVEKLNSEGVKGKALSEVVEMTTELLDEAGYFDGEEDEVLITVTSKDQRRADQLSQEVTAAVEKNEKTAISLKQATMEDREEAQETGMSTGQYLKSLETSEKRSKADSEAVPEVNVVEDSAVQPSIPVTPAVPVQEITVPQAPEQSAPAPRKKSSKKKTDTAGATAEASTEASGGDGTVTGSAETANQGSTSETGSTESASGEKTEEQKAAEEAAIAEQKAAEEAAAKAAEEAVAAQKAAEEAAAAKAAQEAAEKAAAEAAAKAAAEEAAKQAAEEAAAQAAAEAAAKAAAEAAQAAEEAAKQAAAAAAETSVTVPVAPTTETTGGGE